ncbi:MAG: cysteine-rich CWC family protein [Bacteroidales bacterium]|nr:cysteine-rich CWC family protein [Bacteroidales bacterium]
MLKTCPRCQRRFQCTGDYKCNCMNTKTNPEKLAEVRKTYKSCLCPKCLQSLCGTENENDLHK